MNELEPGSDLWWFNRLWVKLSRAAPEAALYNSWVAGDPPIPAPDNDKPGFERLQRIARVNVAGLIVEARLHRLQLLGAETGSDSSADGDDIVRRFFVEQDLKRKFQVAFRDALVCGHGYLVFSEAGVLVSSPANTVVEEDSFGRTVAALTVRYDPVLGRQAMVLMRPGYSVQAVTKSAYAKLLPANHGVSFLPSSWEFQDPVENSFEGVPVYAVGDGQSLIAKHLPTLERINHGVLQRLILIAMQAFRQRAITNAPDRDEHGQEIDYDNLFESAPDALWMLPEGTSIWESASTDFTPVLVAVRDDLKVLAVESKTPNYMISPDDANGSAEGAHAQRETLIFDVEALIASFEGVIKRFISDVLVSLGEAERADVSNMQLLWANPRRSSVMERAEAARAASDAGVPFRLVMKNFAELTPEEVEQAMQGRVEDVYHEVVKGVG
ncbi:hypothetical protein ACN082_09815 [Rothia sp. CCM 9417]|uniref:hypothetical protein n=1 Tax=Rothia sp. CCM 9417 TaxID=3402657 RepID=UPI003ADC8575